MHNVYVFKKKKYAQFSSIIQTANYKILKCRIYV
jgi:hypothetical protein